jgi:hypothetical protein
MSGEWAEANRVANQARVVFIDACRAQKGIVFEGGFWARKRVPVSGYESYTDPVDYPHPVYIEKTRRSAVVFNTPSYKWCHSWKLGEFLAMGKAIVSRIESRPPSSAAIRSIPSAIPPCGGAP